jgi:hypothetical protein
VRSFLLGFKSSTYTPEYSFMDAVVDAVPVSRLFYPRPLPPRPFMVSSGSFQLDVFSACRLFYPLYSIADEDAIELDESYSSQQFFSHFYGGPYSIRHSTLRKCQCALHRHEACGTPIHSADKDLSVLLMDMLNISADSSGDNSGSYSFKQSPDKEAGVFVSKTAKKQRPVDSLGKSRASSV